MAYYWQIRITLATLSSLLYDGSITSSSTMAGICGSPILLALPVRALLLEFFIGVIFLSSFQLALHHTVGMVPKHYWETSRKTSYYY